MEQVPSPAYRSRLYDELEKLQSKGDTGDSYFGSLVVTLLHLLRSPDAPRRHLPRAVVLCFMQDTRASIQVKLNLDRVGVPDVICIVKIVTAPNCSFQLQLVHTGDAS